MQTICSNGILLAFTFNIFIICVHCQNSDKQQASTNLTDLKPVSVKKLSEQSSDMQKIYKPKKQFPTEGGGIESKLKFDNIEIESTNDNEHVTKMVQNSVVPRKGVEKENNLTATNVPENEDIVTAITTKPEKSLNNSVIINQHLEIKKKPESASDDTKDEGNNFSSGKDYVLTGIAIFICIWGLIFGVLFFYKRAGEIWDRRHYRRMDFLVEGMYND
uniref:Uncharacterized protein n=1 Tax=Clastoptera arizonana TaxID=38151 RepID=A0A1B6D7U2_9HEMI